MSVRAVELLSRLIATPSLSRHEEVTADIISEFLCTRGIEVNRQHNNVWAVNKHYDPSLQTLMLNSHHDTVAPAPSYSFDPFKPHITDGRLYGLGSNDAGASVVSLAEVFCRLYDTRLPVNLLLALTAEEEVMGENGMRAFLPMIKDNGFFPSMAIVGEPTGLNPAVGERGLVVLDCVAHGVTGHAARNEGVNAIYEAIRDIQTLRELSFPKVSELLGPIKITVTQISAGRQHNVIPEECRFVADVRTTDAYSNAETVELIREAVKSDITPRSTRIHASAIPLDHPLVVAAMKSGATPFVSPTTSDMALMPEFPTLKIGPGESSRSHAADEYIYMSEIDDAIKTYTQIISSL